MCISSGSGAALRVQARLTAQGIASFVKERSRVGPQQARQCRGRGLTRNGVIDAVLHHLVHLLDGLAPVQAVEVYLPHGAVVFVPAIGHTQGQKTIRVGAQMTAASAAIVCMEFSAQCWAIAQCAGHRGTGFITGFIMCRSRFVCVERGRIYCWSVLHVRVGGRGRENSHIFKYAFLSKLVRPPRLPLQFGNLHEARIQLAKLDI